MLNLLGTFWPSLIRPVFCAYSNDLSLLFGLLSVYEKGELFLVNRDKYYPFLARKRMDFFFVSYSAISGCPL